MPLISSRFFLVACCTLCLTAAPASAIISQPDALKDSGAITVNLDVEIGEGLTLLKSSAIQAHAEDRLQAAGIAVVRETQDQELPGVVTQEERRFAQLRISLAVRPISDPPGYILDIVVSHLQDAMLHPRQIAVPGLDWQEAWASIVPGEGDVGTAVNGTLDHILDDFIKDDELANQPPLH